MNFSSLSAAANNSMSFKSLTTGLMNNTHSKEKLTVNAKPTGAARIKEILKKTNGLKNAEMMEQYHSQRIKLRSEKDSAVQQ